MFELLSRFDQQITNLIFYAIPHTIFFDYFFSSLSAVGGFIGLWIVFVILLIIFEEHRNKQFIFYFTISLITTAFFVNVVLKNVVQRPRPPSYTNVSTNNVCPKDYAFPSGHASAAFAAATILCVFDRKRRWHYFGVAGFISLSRIYLGCHYFLDVAAGATIGASMSYLILKLKRFPLSPSPFPLI